MSANALTPNNTSPDARLPNTWSHPVRPHPVLREDGRDARGNTLTPTQATLHAARRERLGRIAAAAARFAATQVPPPPITELVAEPDATPVLVCAEPAAIMMPDPLAAALAMPRKPPWFHIEGERDADQGPEIRDIQQAVCLHYGVTLADLLSPRRPASIVRPRQVAVYLARELTLLSLPQIGARFGGRDHSTVLVTHRKISRLIASSARLAVEVETLRAKLTAPFRAG
jgi:hypothetical protein